MLDKGLLATSMLAISQADALLCSLVPGKGDRQSQTLQINKPKARSLTEVGETVATTSFHSLLPGGGERSTLTGGLSHQRINLGGRVSSPLHNWSCCVHFRSHLLSISASVPIRIYLSHLLFSQTFSLSSGTFDSTFLSAFRFSSHLPRLLGRSRSGTLNLLRKLSESLRCVTK
ncbi:hypothetical protein BJX62DRAFT_135520 [Aspergillus germanicus]